MVQVSGVRHHGPRLPGDPAGDGHRHVEEAFYAVEAEDRERPAFQVVARAWNRREIRAGAGDRDLTQLGRELIGDLERRPGVLRVRRPRHQWRGAVCADGVRDRVTALWRLVGDSHRDTRLQIVRVQDNRFMVGLARLDRLVDCVFE